MNKIANNILWLIDGAIGGFVIYKIYFKNINCKS